MARACYKNEIEKKNKQVKTNISASDYIKLKDFCQKNNMSVYEVVNIAITKLLSRVGE